jgi:hypothetical protein
MDEQTKLPRDTGVFQDELGAPVPIDPAHASQIEHQWKLYTARFEYAWRYFDFHAKQRTTMFNFFVVFSGFVVTALVSLFQKGDDGLLLIASGFGTVITLFFVFLERRNEELVHIAEDVLRALEKDVLFKDCERTIKWPKQRTWLGKMVEAEKKGVTLGILIRQDYDEQKGRKSRYEHGKWLPRIQYAIAASYVLFLLFAIFGSCISRLLAPLWHRVLPLCRA